MDITFQEFNSIVKDAGQVGDTIASLQSQTLDSSKPPLTAIQAYQKLIELQYRIELNALFTSHTRADLQDNDITPRMTALTKLFPDIAKAAKETALKVEQAKKEAEAKAKAEEEARAAQLKAEQAAQEAEARARIERELPQMPLETLQQEIETLEKRVRTHTQKLAKKQKQLDGINSPQAELQNIRDWQTQMEGFSKAIPAGQQDLSNLVQKCLNRLEDWSKKLESLPPKVQAEAAPVIDAPAIAQSFKAITFHGFGKVKGNVEGISTSSTLQEVRQALAKKLNVDLYDIAIVGQGNRLLTSTVPPEAALEAFIDAQKPGFAVVRIANNPALDTLIFKAEHEEMDSLALLWLTLEGIVVQKEQGSTEDFLPQLKQMERALARVCKTPGDHAGADILLAVVRSLMPAPPEATHKTKNSNRRH